MRKNAAAIAILTCIFLLCGCSQHSWSSALRLAEITESGIDLSGVTLSEDGAEFFNKITDRLKSDTEDMGQFDIVVQETQMLPLMVDILWKRAINKRVRSILSGMRSASCQTVAQGHCIPVRNKVLRYSRLRAILCTCSGRMEFCHH